MIIPIHSNFHLPFNSISPCDVALDRAVWRLRAGVVGTANPLDVVMDGIVPWFVLPPLVRSTRIEELGQVLAQILMVMMIMMMMIEIVSNEPMPPRFPDVSSLRRSVKSINPFSSEKRCF